MRFRSVTPGKAKENILFLNGRLKRVSHLAARMCSAIGACKTGTEQEVRAA